jgi:hypothetical protein
VNIETRRLSVLRNFRVDGMRRLEGGVHPLQSPKEVSRRVPMEPRARTQHGGAGVEATAPQPGFGSEASVAFATLQIMV